MKLEGSQRRNVHHRKIHEDVTSLLLEDIRSGVYQIGQELPSERALMQEFGVGRPAIRESMAKLARMGVVEIRPGMRTRVCPVSIAPLLEEMDGAVKMSLLTPAGQRHMQQIRLLFEVGVGRLVAKQITNEQMQMLEAFQRECELCLHDPVKFADLDVKFHRMLGEATQNPFITAVYDAFGKWLLQQRLTNNSNNPERTTVALSAHQKILDALRTRDPDLVEEALYAHLSDVQNHFWAVMEKNRLPTPAETRSPSPEANTE